MPQLAISIEDAIPQQFSQGLAEPRAFFIVRKVCFQHVLHVLWACGVDDFWLKWHAVHDTPATELFMVLSKHLQVLVGILTCKNLWQVPDKLADQPVLWHCFAAHFLLAPATPQ